MREGSLKQEYGTERSVSITVEEMKSFYRYMHCCQLLHSGLCRGMYMDACDDLKKKAFCCCLKMVCRLDLNKRNKAQTAKFITAIYWKRTAEQNKSANSQEMFHFLCSCFPSNDHMDPSNIIISEKNC